MRRFLVLFSGLFVTNLLAAPAVSFFAFRHVDIRLAAVVALLAVPACQAAVLYLVTAQGLSTATFRPLATPAAALVLALDVAAAPLGLFLHPLYAAGKLAVAGLLLAAAGGRLRSPLPAVAGLGSIAFASDAVRPWLHLIPESVMGGKPIVLKWIVVYGALFATALVVVLLAGRALGGAPDLWLQAASLAAFAAALVAIPAYYQRPVLVGGSAKAVAGLGSLVATCLLAAGLTSWWPASPRSR